MNWKNKQLIKGLKVPALNSIDEKPVLAENPSLQEKMSLAGIGNAAAGAAIAEIAKNIITPNANKPATKKDIDDLKAFFKARYYIVKNMNRDIHGRSAYYDILSGNIIYK
ncbi:hypothetical protein A9200_18065 [Maribacter hydrothermalis]|uniref:Uncharacterized protein n=1 Tax=Maribacter hydrothermalis TaxID=1836467 RepID=A0A1B7Z648_9FLAO|nr:hypothetical protein BTR34_05060 [Maribacter hydrothermalis]OBR38187.1 hypothetical protein A9200_18065 [Maribacter hydrothermalis]